MTYSQTLISTPFKERAEGMVAAVLEMTNGESYRFNAGFSEAGQPAMRAVIKDEEYAFHGKELDQMLEVFLAAVEKLPEPMMAKFGFYSFIDGFIDAVLEARKAVEEHLN